MNLTFLICKIEHGVFQQILCDYRGEHKRSFCPVRKEWSCWFHTYIERGM